MQTKGGFTGPWYMLTWQQCLMGSKLPNKRKSGVTLWTLVRGSVIWICWITRNAKVFSNEDLPKEKIKLMVWEVILDHGRTDWLRITKLIVLYPNQQGSSSHSSIDIGCHSISSDLELSL
uniref:Reverse transcriptase zinc-binding domain-containing protein n=2 Tax=Physcomitrium patens TaxID=3218 RepID=A0A7I3ZDU9_PHYPA